MKENPAAFVGVVLLTAVLSLATVTLLIVSAEVDRRLTERMKGFELEIVLEGEEDAVPVSSRVSSLPCVESIEYFSSAQTFAFFREVAGDSVAQGIENAVDAPAVPPFIEMAIDAGACSPERIASLLQSGPGVREVIYARRGYLRAERDRRRFSSVLGIVRIVWVAGLLVVILIAGRLRFALRSSVIAVIRSLGGSELAVRGPLIGEGALIGILGSEFGLLLAYLLFKIYSRGTPFLSSLRLDVTPAAATVVLFCGLWGLAGAISGAESGRNGE
ncbi:MAG: hypothetical protein D6679_08850 [Candidatus Hydrogenedentota bacterium]|nr:MAG: hypothetical protein D6679_08850 [Candidatus Hydrogenedentota bacterium]